MQRYTVKDVARLSGVTVRTLHFYDEIGLLKLAHYGENGYRYYEKEQLLGFQQIMFYRELGVSLEQIRAILQSPEFDRLGALQSHRERMEQEIDRHRRLLRTIDDTIAELKGADAMSDQNMFQGFSAEKQEQYEKELVDTYGDGMHAKIDESKQRIKGWTREDWVASSKRWNDFLSALGAFARDGKAPDSAEVQSLMPTHHKWLEQYWTPARDSYIGLGQMYASHPDFRSQFDAVQQGLADFCAEAMRVYAERKLPQ